MRQPFDDDLTVRLTKPLPSRGRRGGVPIWAIVTPLLLLVVAALGAGGWWFLLRTTPTKPVTAPVAALQRVPVAPEAAKPETVPAPAPVAVAPPPMPVPPPPEFTIEDASEQRILDHVPAEAAPDPTVFRFKPNPRVLVLDFASLRDQGHMLNRTAALVEKTGLPRDRLLNDTELDSAIRGGGDTAETYYYGHDYSGAALTRFFALADRDSVHLSVEEETLHRLLRQEDLFAPNAQEALISIPQVGADPHVTRVARATILHHELSHGEYFTNPAYTAFVHRFWTVTLTSAERDRIRRHLRTLGYDAGLEDVMENEAQAYLMFTDSPEFFTPEMIGMGKSRLAELRNGFYRTMPAGWLRDSLGQTLTLSKTAAGAHP